MDEAHAKEYLLQNDHEFRQLAQRHRDYERQLEELQSKPYLNEQEQLEETVIKKKKLVIKDQMQLLIYRYQTEHPVS